MFQANQTHTGYHLQIQRAQAHLEALLAEKKRKISNKGSDTESSKKEKDAKRIKLKVRLYLFL